jgi:predicted homoserine dehydrogenase-like protein
MNLHRLLQARAAADDPVRVGVIGCGKFASMYLAQVPRIPGVHVAAIADIDPAARATIWSASAGPVSGSVPRT